MKLDLKKHKKLYDNIFRQFNLRLKQEEDLTFLKFGSDHPWYSRT